ncbi:MAG: SocA family protein [Ardenticatenia bacterium]|nr:SocA family protein [Ardenticatenia bacterium]
MACASTVAKYLLALVSEDDGDLMSNLKLQKLLYYVQGFHLAIYDAPLFPDPIEAWKHGPVVPSVYEEYREHTRYGIPCPEGVLDEVNAALTEAQKTLIADVYREYGMYEASVLLKMTHSEPPWRATRIGAVMDLDAMRQYFLTQVEG